MYQVPASRVHPICIVFLLDQSQSMSEPISGSTTPKAIVLAEVVNNALYELILRTVKDPREGPRHYYDIGLIGYSDEAHHLFSGPLAGRSLVSNSELAKSPVRVDTVDAGGGRMAKKPVFVEPVSKGWTKMCEALDLCGGLVNQWLQQPGHQNSFPPIVVNVSDGEATDGAPTEWSRRLRRRHWRRSAWCGSRRRGRPRRWRSLERAGGSRASSRAGDGQMPNRPVA